MKLYTQQIYNQRINWSDVISLSANIGVLAILYTFVGALVSYVFYYIFDEYGPNDDPPRGKEWESKPTWYKLYDICFEIATIGLLSFWLTFYINSTAYIFPVRKSLISFVDTYTTGMFFMFTVFLFMNDLSDKLIHTYNSLLGKHFDWLFPQYGSILDLSLSYKPPRKTDQSNSTQ